MSRAVLEGAVLRGMDAACDAPMQWGRDDCALWCGNIIMDALGYDPCADWRGRYSDCAGARGVLGRLGLGFALRLAAGRHGWQRIEASAARVGDIGLAMIGGVPVTMVCRAPGWFVGRNENGCTMIDAAVIRVCWRVLP